MFGNIVYNAGRKCACADNCVIIPMFRKVFSDSLRTDIVFIQMRQVIYGEAGGRVRYYIFYTNALSGARTLL